MRPLRLSRTLALLAVFWCVGCSPGGARISGKVTLGGNPISEGRIEFLAPGSGSGPVVAGATIKDGVFNLEGNNLPAAGKYRIAVWSSKKTGKMIAAGSPAPPGTMVEETIESVPSKYNKETTIERELKNGPNNLEIQLDS